MELVVPATKVKQKAVNIIIAIALDGSNGHTATNLELAEKYLSMMSKTVGKCQDEHNVIPG